MGWESGVDKKPIEAPWFYGLYFGLIFLGAGIVLYPDAPLIMMMYLSQVANGVLLPFVLIFIQLLINDNRLVGNYVNSYWYNITAWITTWVMIGLTILLLITTFSPNILG